MVMKVVVIYDSVYGNTEKVASAIAGELVVLGSVDTLPVGQMSLEKLQGAGLLVVGSPTQAFRPTVAMKNFLDGIPAAALKDISAAVFDTRIPMKILKLAGYADKHIGIALRKKGANLIAASEGFIVKGKEGPLAEGEIERARNWARQIVDTLNAPSVIK
jgi:flavodoxin I